MSDKEGHWTLGIQVNRKIGDKTYTSLRLYVPSNNDKKLLLKKLLAEGAMNPKNYTSTPRSRSGSTILLRQVQPQTRPKATRPSLGERADRIIAIITQLGGTTTWPAVREKLGLPSESTPSPFLVKELRDRGLLTIKNPKTSTMTWKLHRQVKAQWMAQ